MSKGQTAKAPSTIVDYWEGAAYFQIRYKEPMGSSGTEIVSLDGIYGTICRHTCDRRVLRVKGIWSETSFRQNWLEKQSSYYSLLRDKPSSFWFCDGTRRNGRLS